MDKLINGLTHLYPEKVFLKNLSKAVEMFPKIAEEDFLTQGQIKSKRWLIEELKKLSLDLGVIYLTPGWYGLLAQFISEENLNFSKIRSFDIDQKSTAIAEVLNRNLYIDEWKFKATTLDILKINYEEHSYTTIKKGGIDIELTEVPDTIINTACEHLDYQTWLSLIPKNKFVIIQNNDFFDCAGHTHCVSSLEEFREKCALSEIYYSGVLNLDNYNRYMLIGRK